MEEPMLSSKFVDTMETEQSTVRNNTGVQQMKTLTLMATATLCWLSVCMAEVVNINDQSLVIPEQIGTIKNPNPEQNWALLHSRGWRHKGNVPTVPAGYTRRSMVWAQDTNDVDYAVAVVADYEDAPALDPAYTRRSTTWAVDPSNPTRFDVTVVDQLTTEYDAEMAALAAQSWTNARDIASLDPLVKGAFKTLIEEIELLKAACINIKASFSNDCPLRQLGPISDTNSYKGKVLSKYETSSI